MKFYIDCEFNSFQGELISMAIVCEKGELYMVNKDFADRAFNYPGMPRVSGTEFIHPWVKENVLPYVWTSLNCNDMLLIPKVRFKQAISRFIYDKMKAEEVIIYADWWTDIEHFCNVMVGDNGSTVTLNKSRKYGIIVDRTVDGYEDPLPGSIQHNALWDARNIMRAFKAKYGE